jgi:hypothetical protein
MGSSCGPAVARELGFVSTPLESRMASSVAPATVAMFDIRFDAAQTRRPVPGRRRPATGSSQPFDGALRTSACVDPHTHLAGDDQTERHDHRH